MFVMSSLDFTHYMNKLDATHAAHFPLPGDLPSTQREGDFDVIVIHREYGVLLGEIKSVGIHGDNPTDKAVADKVTKAVKQLDSLAASRLIEQQLVMTLQADPTTQQAAAAVHFLQYDLVNQPGDVKAALQRVQSLENRPGHTETGANINPTSVGTTTSPPRLQYRDVIVLTRNAELLEETRDVRERRIVVWLPGRMQSDDNDGNTDDVVEASDRVELMSRCNTQLVIVDVPL
nr:hypothetical protein BaRGS_009781 [Batillaria attramentaria]